MRWVYEFFSRSLWIVISGVLALVVLTSCSTSSPTATYTSTPHPPPEASTPPPSASEDLTPAFTIQIRFIDEGFTLEQQQLFQAAGRRWAQTILTDLPNTSLRLPAAACLSGSPPISQSVDDLLIDASAVDLDGAGNILGKAGPCALGRNVPLPVYGVVQFDRADVEVLEQAGQLQTVILHEIGHVLGLGTLWKDRGLVVGLGSADPRYRGANGNREFNGLGGVGAAAVENQGGEGTLGMHWREALFEDELMTSSLDTAVANPLSILTLAALQDLGYAVDLTKADPYTLSSADGNLPTVLLEEGSFQLQEILLQAPLPSEIGD
jgi:hypothetical protein